MNVPMVPPEDPLFEKLKAALGKLPPEYRQEALEDLATLQKVHRKIQWDLAQQNFHY